MTKDEIMHLVNRSLFATIGYTDEVGRQNVRRVFCVWHKGLGRHLISTNTSSAHVQSLLKNGNACLYFCDDSAFEGLCLFEDDDYCILEFIAEGARFYRFNGKGDLSASEIETYDKGRNFENGYNSI